MYELQKQAVSLRIYSHHAGEYRKRHISVPHRPLGVHVADTDKLQSIHLTQGSVKWRAHLFDKNLTRSILGTTTATQKVPDELVQIPSRNPGSLLMRTSFRPA